MTKIDPIIAVKDVEASKKWYQSIFECVDTHDGKDFAVLESKDGEVLLCLHEWNEHNHPTMKSPSVTPGNGLILYFRTMHMKSILERVGKIHHPIADAVHLNENSGKLEFSIRDLDGYYLTIAEYHHYKG